MISRYEKGERNLTDRTISAICREFNVNEEWLRIGEGEIFVETDESILAQVKKEYNLDDISLEIITEFLTLDVVDRKVIADFIKVLRKQADNDANSKEVTNPKIKVLEKTTKKEPTYTIFTASRSTNDEEMKNIQLSKTEYDNFLNELESAPGVEDEKDL